MSTGIGIGAGIGFIPKEIEGAYEPILDTLPGAVYAGSLRLLRTAYAGPVVELHQYASANIDDFFADGAGGLINGAGQTPTEWLLSLGEPIDAGLRVRTLYNQSAGAASDLTQTSQSLQPHVWKVGDPDYYRIGANNRITLRWDAFDDALISSGFAGYPNVSCFVVEELLPTEPAHLLINGVNSGFYRIVSEIGAVTPNVAGTVYVNGVPTGSTTREELYTDIQGVYNGTGVGAIASQFIDFDMPVAGYSTWYLNKYSSGSYFSNSCKIAELIMYPADMSSSITAISNNQRSYYGI